MLAPHLHESAVRVGGVLVALWAMGCGSTAPSSPAPDGGAHRAMDAGEDTGEHAADATHTSEAGHEGGRDAGAHDTGPAIDAGQCPLADAGSGFGGDILISTPGVPSFAASAAALAGTALVAFHQVVDGGTQVAYSVITEGCVGPLQTVPDSLPNPKLPQAAATTHGFTLVYEATDGALDVVRRVDLDADGTVQSAPTTLTLAGASGEMPHVAASGDDLAFAWTDGEAFFYARSGPGETVAATAVGNTLLDPVLTVFPRVALGPDGTMFIGYCDGSGGDESSWDALLLVRPKAGTFAAPVDLSNDPGLFDDDLALTVEPSGALDVVWVAEDASNVNDADVVYVVRDSSGAISSPKAFASQGSQAWQPAVAPGLLTVWTLGGATGGQLYFAAGPAAPSAILTPADAPALALGPDGALHAAFQTAGASGVMYARRH